MSPPPPRPGALPSIVVAPTPANDLYLMLSLLIPTQPVARLISDPVAFLREHRTELRVFRELVRARESAPASASPDPPPPAPPPGDSRRRRPARIARGESLLR